MNANRGFALAVLSLVLLGLVGCLRPAEQRAALDDTVGRLRGQGYTVEVAEGLATIREQGAEALTLWGNAPVLDLAFAWQEPPSSFVLTVHNCLPDAELVTDATVEGLPAEVPTVRRWRLSAIPASLRVRVAPPDADLGLPFRFAVLSDVQEAIGEVQDIWQRVNQEPTVRFVLGAGDLTSIGTEEELRRFQEELRGLRVPYFATLGNHELQDEPELWVRFFGRASSQFFFRQTAFTLVDSASATVDPLVYERLDHWLERARDRLHLVAMHIPPVDPVGVRDGSFASRDEAAFLLGKLGEGGVDLTIYGHVHSYYSFFNAGIPAFISGGGGAIPERFDSIGRHFLVLEADPLLHHFTSRVVRVD